MAVVFEFDDVAELEERAGVGSATGKRKSVV